MPVNILLSLLVCMALLDYPAAGQLPDDQTFFFQLPSPSVKHAKRLVSDLPLASASLPDDDKTFFLQLPSNSVNRAKRLASDPPLAGASSPSSAQLAKNLHDAQQSATQYPVPHMAARLAVCGLCLGAVFGLMGSGGAMIAKWMLYYVLNIRPFKLTIFTMYLILCPMSAFGALRGMCKGKVHWPHVVQLFVFASSIGTTLGARLATFIPDRVQLLCFGTLILGVSAHILYKQLATPMSKPAKKKSLADQVTFAMVAVVVGCLCGTLGVGGGFMLVPVLLHAGHDIKTAVPTSLAVITVNAAVSACWYLHLFGMDLQVVDLTTVASFLLLGCLGMTFSDNISSVMSNKARQCSFALLLFAIGIFTVAVELCGMAL